MKKLLGSYKNKFIIFTSIIVIIIGGYLYGSIFLPNNYTIKHHSISKVSLDKNCNGLKIAYLSDINLKNEKDLDKLSSIVEAINKSNANVVLFGGDLFNGQPYNEEKVSSILKNLKSDSGKFAVLGDKDLVYPEQTKKTLINSGFEVLHNEFRRLYYNNSSIALFGLENSGNLNGLIDNQNKDLFKLVLVHQPDYFKETQETDIDLQISGHTMGGYINIPFYGGIYKKEDGKIYNYGTYEHKNSTLIVSSGVGMENNYNFRLFTSNQANIITLHQKSK